MNNKHMIEIVEWYSRKIPLYEIMTGEEYDKKKKGESYKTLYSSDFIPFTEFGEPRDADYIGLKQWMSFEEAEKRFNL